MVYEVHVEVRTVDGVQAKAVQTDVSFEHLEYLLGGIPLAYSLPLSKQLRERGLLNKPVAANGAVL